MKTAEEMTVTLQLVFDELKRGEADRRDTRELINCVGKMIGLAKVQLEYHTLRNEAPNLAFFASSSVSTGGKRPRK